MNKELEYIIKNIIKESIDNVCFLNESQESKSISAAKKIVKLKYPEANPVDIIDDIRSLFPILRTKTGGKFIEGTTRLLINDKDSDLNDHNFLIKFGPILNFIIQFKYDNYDRNFNGLSYEQLLDDINDDYHTYLNNKQYKICHTKYTKPNDNYKVVRITDPLMANNLVGDYCDWCIANSSYNQACISWNTYTANNKYNVFFIMHEDFEDIPKKVENNTPYDTYGLSLICVMINPQNLLVSCTSRWNHSYGGNEHMMDEEQISKLIGINFYDAFKYEEPTELPKSVKHYSLNDCIESIKDGTFKLDYTEMFKKQNISFYYLHSLIDGVSSDKSIKNLYNIIDFNNVAAHEDDFFEITYDAFHYIPDNTPFAICYNNDNNKFLIMYADVITDQHDNDEFDYNRYIVRGYTKNDIDLNNIFPEDPIFHYSDILTFQFFDHKKLNIIKKALN